MKWEVIQIRDPSYRIIGMHLRKARELLKLKQADVARIADVSLPYYGKLERGKISPSLDRLMRICKVLQLPLTEVFKGVMPLEESFEHDTPTAVEFVDFFSHIADRVSDHTKSVMVEVCRQIETLSQ